MADEILLKILSDSLRRHGLEKLVRDVEYLKQLSSCMQSQNWQTEYITSSTTDHERERLQYIKILKK